MKQSTLLFLIKRDNQGNLNEICLAMKKRGFGVGRWNGAGGKANFGETVEEATIRETQEELVVTPTNLKLVANLVFNFENQPEWNQNVTVYFSEAWIGQPTETEEMKPAWFDIPKIPYDEMWPDDIFWLPLVIDGKYVEAEFTFGENDIILKHEVKTKDWFTTHPK